MEHAIQSSGQESPTPKVASPFANATVSVPTKPASRARLVLWIGLALILVIGGAVGGILITSFLRDPYRTLEAFPVNKYFEGHRSLAGAKFKGELRVEADLGWKEEVGRLMLFSTKNDSRPVAIMIPAVVANNNYFTKGQTYLAELEVKEGGLIYANSIRKN